MSEHTQPCAPVVRENNNAVCLAKAPGHCPHLTVPRACPQAQSPAALTARACQPSISLLVCCPVICGEHHRTLWLVFWKQVNAFPLGLSLPGLCVVGQCPAFWELQHQLHVPLASAKAWRLSGGAQESGAKGGAGCWGSGAGVGGCLGVGGLLGAWVGWADRQSEGLQSHLRAQGLQGGLVRPACPLGLPALPFDL